MKENLIQKMKALSNECRVDLFLTLAKAGKPMRVGELAEEIGHAEARISRALHILFYAGLVVAERKGARVFYNLNTEDCVAVSLSKCLIGAVEVGKGRKLEEDNKRMVR